MIVCVSTVTKPLTNPPATRFALPADAQYDLNLSSADKGLISASTPAGTHCPLCSQH